MFKLLSSLITLIGVCIFALRSGEFPSSPVASSVSQGPILSIIPALSERLLLARPALVTTYTYLPVILTPASEGRIYYVSIHGQDNNPGAITQPWRTLQKAANTLQAGDKVYVRAGVYNERVTVNISGSASGGYITFQNYPGETAILDGTGLSVPAAESGMFLITNRNYLIIAGFQIRNYKTSQRERVPVGIYVQGTSHHIQLKNNRIHNIETNATPSQPDLLGANAHGIAVYGTSALTSIHHLLIESNELYNLKLGSSEALVLNGNVEIFTVTNNIVHDSDNIGIDLIGFEGTSPDPLTDQARNGVVISNTVYNIDSLTNPAYGGGRSAGGIYVDGGRAIVVERNRIYNSNIGIEIASEHGERSTSFITVRNNFVFNNHIAGIALGGYDTERGRTENCLIVNNTLFNNDTQEEGNGELLIQFDTRNNLIKNNIFYNHQSQSLLIGNIYSQNTGNIIDYNLYFAPAGATDSEWQWKNVTYQGFAAYQVGTGNDAHSRFMDPLLLNLVLPDLHLQAASPGRNSGQNLPDLGQVDIDGQPRVAGGTVDIGADEHWP